MSGKYDVQAALSWQEESRQFINKAGRNAAITLHNQVRTVIHEALEMNPCLAACSSCGKECASFATLVGDKQFCSDCVAAEAHVPHMTAAQQRFHAKRRK